MERYSYLVKSHKPNGIFTIFPTLTNLPECAIIKGIGGYLSLYLIYLVGSAGNTPTYPIIAQKGGFVKSALYLFSPS